MWLAIKQMLPSMAAKKGKLMDLLSGSPYLLNEITAQKILSDANKLNDDVNVLRKKGSLTEEVLKHLREEWRIKQVHESTGIEGNELTISETQMAIQRGITISGKPPEHSDEVRQLNGALEFLEQLSNEKKPFIKREICEIQSLILGRGNHYAGVYRAIEVEITNSPHKPPHPIKVPEYMNDYIKWIEKSYHDLPVPLLAAVCHAWLVYIHPFADGNGRTARAVMNLLLMRFGFPIVIIRKSDRQRYYEALHASDDSDITPLFELITERCRDSLEQIDRIRTAYTGVSIELERLKEQRELQYKAWLDGIFLFRSTFTDILKQIELKDQYFHIFIKPYDPIDFEDYDRIINHESISNSWFFKFSIEYRPKSCIALFWVGYASYEITKILNIKDPIPCLKLSVPNNESYPAWMPPTDNFCSSKREIAYYQGKYYCLVKTKGNTMVKTYENVFVLASEFVQEIVKSFA
jgi:Fic family protein